MKFKTLFQGSFIALCLTTAVIAVEFKPNPVMVEGDEAYKAGNYDLAISKYTQVIEKEPKKALAYTNRALAYKEKKNYDGAIADFNKSLRLQPQGYVYYDRGITFQETGSDEKAIADFTTALKVGVPGILRVDCLVARAHSYAEKENATAALSDLNQAVKLGTDDPDAYVLRGVVQKVEHKYDRSLADYEKAIALDPKCARAFDAEAYLLSVCPMPKYRDGKKAIAYATKACELSKWQRAGYLETLAMAYAETGTFDEAIKWQTKAGEIDAKAANQSRLALYQQKQPFRDLNRTEPPVANLSNIQDKISISFRQKLNARLEANGDQLVHPTVESGNEERLNSISLDFHQEKRGRTLFITHSFARTMRAKCLARLKDYDTYFETDILPIPPKTTNPEIWSDPIEELVLFDLRLTTGEPDQQLPAVSFSQSRCSRSLKLALLENKHH
jgi:tetratricopeptide (TPR) repeat protein